MIAARAQEGNTVITLPVSKMENLTPEETGLSKVSCHAVPYGIPLRRQPAQHASRDWW